MHFHFQIITFQHRLLVSKARKIAEEYYLTYHEPIPTPRLVQQVGFTMQQYSHSRYMYFTCYILCCYCIGLDK